MVFKEVYNKYRTLCRRLNRIQGFMSRNGGGAAADKDHSSEAGRGVGMATNASYISNTGFSSKRTKSTGQEPARCIMMSTRGPTYGGNN